MNQKAIHIVGAGLAGSEAAHYLAEHGHRVIVHEMRPQKMTEAHKSSKCAELVCSNSLKSKSPISAPGMLKAEMLELDSLILKTANSASVPGGEALAVDREIFSEKITEALKNHKNIEFNYEEVLKPIAGEITLLATGPLTTEALTTWIGNACATDDLYFYDAIAPIIETSSLDRNIIFLANRYDKGEEEAYLNCPFTEDEYNEFINLLQSGEKVPPKPFEKEKFFQGCQPIEAIAAGGRESLRFGPMKPVGLTDPRTGKRPYAVVQLRPENRSKTAYNMVGFQTKLKYPDQSRIFKKIPGLEKAEFLRMGSIHRNTYVCGPKVLRPDLSLKGYPQVYLAGQITGVEGYLESAACGLMAAVFIDQRLNNQPHHAPPANTALGALLRHIISSDPKNYQPANAHFGLYDPSFFTGILNFKKDELRKAMAEQALENFRNWKSNSETKS